MFEDFIKEIKGSHPLFKAEASQLHLLTSPQAYYKTLLDKIQNSTHRILFASLYLGTDEQERKLVNELQKRLFDTLSTSDLSDNSQKERPIRIHFHLDYNRSHRINPDGKSSVSILTPLINSSPSTCSVSLYRSPLTTGWRGWLFGNRSREIFGTSHMKLAVFDNDIILTGANLSDQYFNNRLDRFLVIQNHPALANYYEELLKTVAKSSYSLSIGGTLLEPQQSDTSLGPALLQLQYEHSQGQTALEGESPVLLVPSLQSALHGVTDDEQLTQHLFTWLENAKSSADITASLATGYFNPAHQITSLISKTSFPWEIVTSSPQANSFYTATDRSSVIPLIYRYIELLFLRSKPGEGRPENMVKDSLFEYNRLGWTFHGKGLWLDAGDVIGAEWLVTTIGSSNYGRRSLERDLENQLLIITADSTLKSQIRADRDSMFKDAIPVTAHDIPEPSLLVRFLSHVLGSFL